MVFGVGKTTFAHRLEQQLPAIRFSRDEWMTRFYGDDPSVERYQDFHRRVCQQVEEIWPRCLGLALNTFEALKGRFEPLEGDEERIEMGIRLAVQSDVPRIMEIRHSVRENRLSDPNLVTDADCAAFIERSEIWVWEEDGAVQGFAAGDTRDGRIWALFVALGYEGRGIGQALLPLACETLRRAGYTTATLSTVEGTRAERFYRTNGWAMTDKNKKGELVFQKRLCSLVGPGLRD